MTSMNDDAIRASIAREFDRMGKGPSWRELAVPVLCAVACIAIGVAIGAAAVGLLS